MGNDQSMEEEIDLFELWDSLVAEKLTILTVFVVSLLVAVVAILVMKPVYKSTAYVLVPMDANVQEMNKFALLTGNSTSFTSGVVFGEFLKNLSSRELKTEIFTQYQLEKIYAPKLAEMSGNKKIAVLHKAQDKFGKDFVITAPKKDDISGTFSISLEMKSSPEEVALILNDMVERAKKKTADQAYEIINTERANRLLQINNEITSLRKVVVERRKDRIVQLDEAIEIAHKLNLAEPKEMGPTVEVQGVSNQGLPLYYLGYTLLEAEKATLVNRKDDESFIGSLRGLQERLAQLEECKLNKEAFGVVRIAEAAFPAWKPVKPNKTMILALAGVVGLMLGIFVASIRSGLKKHRQSQAAGKVV